MMKSKLSILVLIAIVMFASAPISGFAHTAVRYHITNIGYESPNIIRIHGYFMNVGTTEVYNIHDVYFRITDKSTVIAEGVAPPSVLIYETLSPGECIYSSYLIEGCLQDRDLLNAHIGRGFTYDVSKEYVFDKGMKIFLNNAPLTIQGPQPYVDDNQVMVPARTFAQLFGSQIEWIPMENRIIIKRNGSSFSMKIGEKEADFDGKIYEMKNAPVLIDGCAYIPLYGVSSISCVPYEYNRAENILTMTQIPND